MTTGPWEDLLLEVLGEADATAEWDHLLHHVEDAFDAHQFETEIRDAIETLQAENRVTYSGVQGYEVIEDTEDIDEEPARTDGGTREVP